jgi:hypothetical protein
MRILFAVIDDLYTFALQGIASFIPLSDTPDETVSVTQGVEPLLLPARESHDMLTAPQRPSHPPHSFKALKEITHTAIPVRERILEEKNTVMYAGSIDVPLYTRPTQEFDGVMSTITYGDMVMVLEQAGRFMHVAHDGREGWVLREDLVDRAAYVYPEFVIGEKNELDDPNTIRTRAMIKDLFGGSRVEFPLQAGEYVVYRLLRKGIHIMWPETRPRVPGMWHSFLKGMIGVHISISPKTGTVMEYTLPEEIGHVAYVEAVFPDETITISETNFPDSGIYNERVLTRDEWKELTPVFIQIS